MIDLILAIAAAAQAPAAISEPGSARLFGDWAVACDNIRACEALSVASEDWESGSTAALALRREAGSSGEALLAVIVVEETDSRTVSLRIDGQHAGSATLGAQSGHYHFDSNIARAVTIPMIVDGREATLHGETGALIDTISLNGSSAAFRYADDRQGRAGTRGALVANGNAPDETTAPPLPVVRQQPLAARVGETPEPLPVHEAERLHEARMCDGFGIRRTRNDVYPIDDATDLILISCSDGAYNFSDIAFVRNADGSNVRPARFDQIFAWGDEREIPLLVNVGWDAEAGVLSTYAKGRGIGDCGTSETFVWDGDMFRLIHRREMNSCRGAFSWLGVWNAEVEAVEP